VFNYSDRLIARRAFAEHRKGRDSAGGCDAKTCDGAYQH
jgi:hypothetical protein